MDDLNVTPKLTIPDAEMEFDYSTSGGPGGQHANRSATRVRLTFDLAGSNSIDSELKHQMLDALRRRVADGRFADGVIVVTNDATRSQWRNRQAARRQLADVLRDALKPAPRQRRKTKPSRSARERRLSSKRHRSDVKKLRRRPGPD